MMIELHDICGNERISFIFFISMHYNSTTPLPFVNGTWRLLLFSRHYPLSFLLRAPIFQWEQIPLNSVERECVCVCIVSHCLEHLINAMLKSVRKHIHWDMICMSHTCVWYVFWWFLNKINSTKWMKTEIIS